MYASRYETGSPDWKADQEDAHSDAMEAARGELTRELRSGGADCLTILCDEPGSSGAVVLGKVNEIIRAALVVGLSSDEKLLTLGRDVWLAVSACVEVVSEARCCDPKRIAEQKRRNAEDRAEAFA